MKQKLSRIIVTDDNSKTLLIPELNETYHSTKGAVTEANHVFIKEGLLYSGLKNVSIFEMGFGTGLNAIINLRTSIDNSLSITYHCIEAFPVQTAQALEMQYLESTSNKDLKDSFIQMHEAKDGQEIQLHPNFSFTKHLSSIQKFNLPKNQYDIIYYDAFGPKVQPDLWKRPVLTKIVDSMKAGGILVTYCAQGLFKRELKALGMTVEGIPGPPGKREMTRAIK